MGHDARRPLKFALLAILQLAASGSDAYFTHRNQLMPKHYENNPFAAPFVGSTHGQIVFFGVSTGGRIALAALLRHQHHPKLAAALQIESIAENAGSAAFSATH